MSRSFENRLLVAIGVVSFACALVAQFAAQGVALFMRDAGIASATIGLLYIAAIPYTLRFLWAPLIDRVQIGRGGRFGGWLLVSQAAVCLLLLALWAFDPGQSPYAVIPLIGAMMIALGTLQTALGGLMVKGLPDTAYPRGASLQAAASALAGLVLGACILYLLGPLGWGAVILSLLAATALFLVISRTALSFEPKGSPGHTPPAFWSQLSIFRRPEPRRLFAAVFLLTVPVVIPMPPNLCF